MKHFNKNQYRQYRDTPYYVNKSGDVYNINTYKFVEGSPKRKGHLYIQMGRDGKAVAKHKMVADCWIGDTEGMEVHHKDHNPTNNKVSNLEILTSEEHQRKHHRSMICVQFSDDWSSLIRFYNSQNEVEETFGGNRMYNSLSKGYKYKGFNWLRLDNIEDYPNFVTEDVAYIQERLLQLVDKELVRRFAWVGGSKPSAPTKKPYTVLKDAFDGLHYS